MSIEVRTAAPGPGQNPVVDDTPGRPRPGPRPEPGIDQEPGWSIGDRIGLEKSAETGIGGVAGRAGWWCW